MKDIRQSSQYAEYLSAAGWIIEKIPCDKQFSSRVNIFVFIRKLPILAFSVAKIQRFSCLPDFEVIGKIVKKYNILQVTLEPDQILKMTNSELEAKFNKKGFRKDSWPFLPTKSIRIDLSESPKSLLKDSDKDAQQSLRKAEKQFRVSIFNYKDQDKIKRYHNFWQKNGKGPILRSKNYLSLLGSFKKNFFLVCVFSKNGKLLAGTTILIHDSCAYYYNAAVSAGGRKTFAGYLALWEAIKQAQKRNCTIFDLEGIYDLRFSHLKRWKGFSLFKKKFGGKDILYPGSFTRYYFPF